MVLTYMFPATQIEFVYCVQFVARCIQITGIQTMMNCTTPATFAVETVEHSCFPRVLPAVGMFVTTWFHMLTWFI